MACLRANELQLLAYLYQHRGTDWGECYDVSPFRVTSGLQWGDQLLRASAEVCRSLGLVGVGGIPISPFAERIVNLQLTLYGRELMWLLENALGSDKVTTKGIQTLSQHEMAEVDELVDRFLLR